MITSYFKQWTGKDPLPKQILFLMDAEDPNVLSIAVSSGRDTGKTLSL